MTPADAGSDGGREALGFSGAVKTAFRFLRDFGYELVHSEPTLVRYEGDGRYVQIFHGRRGYELGIEFGSMNDPNSATSLSELVNSLEERERYRGFTAYTADAVAAGVTWLSSETHRFEDVLRGDIPSERIERYRQALTDYYAGKNDISPKRGRLP